jgi:cbb3-type cytochrome oxidase maturation protein
MSVLYVLIPLALVFALGALVTFVWVVRQGQLDDLESPQYRALFDEAEVRPEVAPAPRHHGG